ncbi:MAG: lysophospholipid acyltransferase family protein [bacterium]
MTERPAVKIRDPRVIKSIGFVGSHLVKHWVGTLRFHLRFREPDASPAIARRFGKRYIYAFFHENMLFPARYWNWPEMNILISEHADGEMITQIVKRLGFGVVRGSSTRGGVRALIKFQSMESGNLCVTPDGPRGPRRHVHPGMVYLSSTTGLPIICGGMAFKNPWRAKSWDKFAVPRPFSDAVAVGTKPIFVPPNIERDQLDEYRMLIEREMNDVQNEADEWINQF